VSGSIAAASAFADESEDHGAHDDDEVIEEIIVWGRALTQKGTALSASEGLVGYADFSTRPLQRVGELAEVVPGMVATQHSGEGKANQYYLRGMNLDHGTDFSAYFEGMPVNFRTHAHGQGYLDLNFLIPEVISTVRYAKGPYAADRGDFSTAGTTTFSVYDRLDSPFLEVTGGSDGYVRSVAAGSMDLTDGHLLGALEVARNDGPWENEADVEKTNFLGKYSGHWRDFETQLLFTYYDNEWTSTDQVPDRLVSAGSLDRFGFIDPSLGGETMRVNLIAGIDSDRVKAAAYLSRYELNLFGNFTYFAEDPVNGDQHEQVDRRWIYGGFAEYDFEVNDTMSIKVGGDLRNDDISDANLYATTSRVRRSATRRDEVDWLSIGAYSELTVRLSDRLRGTAGVRVDYYDFDVSALNPLNGGSDSETNVIPSLGLAYELNDYVELYANWGEGFHSNDVRGRTITVDPASGDPVDPIELFVDQEGAEVGVRVEGWQGLAATVTYFWLESDSELLFVGDSGSTEPNDASERTGVEVNVFWNINEFWTADLTGSLVDSEFVGVPSGFDHIPNAHGRVVGAGLTYAEPDGWIASVRLRHFGEAPLVEDDSVQHGSTTMVNAGVSYDFGHWEAGLEIVNLFDAEDDDIAYWFESRLAGEPAPVEDVHFHPVDPFSVRASLRFEF
jgi:outer membrane receptor protein involved in Fe transport